MKKIQDSISLLDDIILVAREEALKVDPLSITNKNGGDGFVVFHLEVLRKLLTEVESEICQSQ